MADTSITTPPANPKVGIVILNWNGKEDTLECLASVGQLDYPNYETVVVDNGSADDSVRAISNQFPDILILQTKANLGYAGGNNVGIRWALERGARYVLILNNDTTVDSKMLSQLVAAGLLDTQAGLVGPANYYYNEPTRIWAVGAMHLDPAYCGYRIIGNGDDDTAWNTVTRVDALVGSAMLINRAVFEKIDLFDERFFLCFEEFDFSTRACNAGYTCILVPAAKIWHKVGRSLGKMESPLRTYFAARNKLLWAKKNLPISARIDLHQENFRILRRILLPPLILGSVDSRLARNLLWSFSSWLKTIKRNLDDPTNRATLMGIRDYYRGRFGDCPDQVRVLAKAASEAPRPSEPR